MAAYVLRRIGLFIAGLLVASIAIFFALHVLPGDVAQVIGGINATPEQLDRIREQYGLDQPLAVQYFNWLSGLVRLDLGTSLITHTPIQNEILQKLAVTIPLCVMGLLVAIAIGVPLGVFAALKHDRPIGSAVSFIAQAAAAVPVLWAGLLLILLFGRGVGLIGILPSQGFPLDGWASPWRAFQALVLPAVTIGIVEGAVILRFVRSAVLETLPQDYIRTAMSRGLTQTQAVLRHGLPNASLAVLSIIGLQAASLVSGAVIIETLFALPGLGSKLVADVGNRDLASVQSVVLFLTALVLLVGLLIDVSHRVIDPRQRRLAQ